MKGNYLWDLVLPSSEDAIGVTSHSFPPDTDSGWRAVLLRELSLPPSQGSAALPTPHPCPRNLETILQLQGAFPPSYIDVILHLYFSWTLFSFLYFH